MATIDVLSTVRIGQISGSTGPKWLLLVDPEEKPLLTNTGKWNVMGVDLGANAEHSDGRLYFFFGDVATDRSGDPPENADLVAWTDERTLAHNGGHLAMGWNFTLPVTHGQEGQRDWQFCLKCSALFWNGDPNFKGRCSAGGTHDTFGLGWNFSLPFEPTRIAGQPQWRFCGKCASLFWEGDPVTPGHCPAGDTHIAAGWRFVIPVTPAPMDGQRDWRFCAKCHGLFWDGEASQGICSGSPGGGFHLRGVLQSGTPFGRFDPFRAAEPIGYTGPLETPNGAFSFDRTMYVFAGFAEERWSHIRRPGEPTPGLYLFSKRDPSAPGPYDTEFLFSPKLGWCARDDARTVMATHFVMGHRFMLPHDVAPADHRLAGWRCCRQCEALFWDGDPGFKGVCQRGGPHEADRDLPDDFSFERGLPEDAQNQSNFQRCRKCQSLFWSLRSDDTGLCPAFGRHESAGVVLRVPHRSLEADGVRQPDWRFCRKCFSLFWDGDPNARNVCAKDHGRHERAGFNFLLPFIVGDVAGTAPSWRFCAKCTSLFLEGEPSVCPSDRSLHEAVGWRFPLTRGVPETLERQGSWRRCRKCSGLYFDGFPDNGCCPFDGLGHERELRGPEYVLDHNPGADDNNRDGFRFCVRCHGLVRTDRPVAFPWIAPCVVNNAEHAMLPSDSGRGVVMIGYDWRVFRLAWMPLTPGDRPRFDTVCYYHVGKRAWSDDLDSSPGYELFAHPLAHKNQYTHVSASWLPGPRCWVVVFAAAWDVTREFRQPILARFSPDLVHWSGEVRLFDPTRERAYGVYMHEPGCDQLNPDLPPPQPPNQDNPGWAYGAFILDRYTTWDDANRILTLSYLMSPSSPYQVQVMQTALRLPDPLL